MPKFILNDKLYDLFKHLALYGVSGFGALYLALASTWGWPYSQEVGATCTAISTFIGLFVAKANSDYQSIQIDQGGENG